MAVFSLSSAVPILSLFSGEYYENKIKSIHNIYQSSSVIDIESLNKDILFNFINNLDSLRKKLVKEQKNTRSLYLNKIKLITRVYGITPIDSIQLFNKVNNENINPKITVIIPIYNMDAYIPECLDSVINQTLKELEILCIDDGSTDYSQQVLNEYSWKDKRIRIISQQNHGVSYSRNIGITQSKGEFLFFLDPDDYLPDNEVLADLYNAAIKHGVLICGGGFSENNVTLPGIVDRWDGNLSKYTFSDDTLMNYKDYQFDYGWTRVLYNREFLIYNDLRIPDYTFFEDPVFFVKVMHLAKTFYCLKRCTYCYRTGHKVTNFTDKKVLDLVKGLTENISFALEKNYNSLLSLELARLENDYGDIILNHLLKPSSIELRQLISDLNNLIYNNTDKIENKDNSEMSEIIENSENHLNSETQPANTLPQSNIVLPHPILDLSRDKLSDYDYLMNNFYIVDENTDASAVKINAAEFLAEDFSLSHGPLEPQILIYHSHSQETFSDSREGEEEDTIVGVGNYLTSLLSEKYGYQVIHIKEAFDMMSGELDRNKAYNYACDYVEKVLEENPSVEVVIDLHRDGIDEDRRLVTEINGKDTAQILFYNGLSYTNDQGKVSYLPNPYIQDNLAFSFQLEYQAALYYPDFYRGIYLAGLRYNLHLRKRALLLEAGAQTNTVQEVKNAMEPFADILNRVLKGCGTG